MLRGILGILVIAAILVPVSAEVSLGAWSWNTYQGTEQWSVTVREDQSGCEGPVLTNQYTVPIEFRLATAVMGDVGHGPATGTFTSGNTLHMESRKVDDPPGTSVLSAYDVVFTPDCSGFTASYRWDYSGPDGACSGTTSLSGVNPKGCPASQAAPTVPTAAPASGEAVAGMIAGARYDLDQYLATSDQRTSQERDIVASEIRGQGDASWTTQARQQVAQETAQMNTMGPKVEGEYAAILDKDPTNFWANMDMAQLKKSQGKLDEYVDYVNRALSNEKIAEGTRDAVKKDIAEKNNLPGFPTPDTSFFIQKLGPDVRTSAQNVYGTNVAKEVTGPSVLDGLKYLMTYQGAKNAVNTLVFGGGGS